MRRVLQDSHFPNDREPSYHVSTGIVMPVGMSKRVRAYIMEKIGMTEIRDAKISDVKRLLEIYDYYVQNTAITFEYDTPSVDEFTACNISNDSGK